jgi:hypothetical protein
MGMFRKKADPIKARARALEEEIASLEAQISRLDAQLSRQGQSPSSEKGANGAPRDVPAPRPSEPIFEEVDLARLEAPAEATAKPEHFNELGVRKYDLPALLSRLKNHVNGPATTNPKLVSYLAAGGIQGLRPMRYEKRVARNRFILLVIVLFAIMLGIAAVFVRG